MDLQRRGHDCPGDFIKRLGPFSLRAFYTIIEARPGFIHTRQEESSLKSGSLM